jgi:hypothetical protein
LYGSQGTKREGKGQKKKAVQIKTPKIQFGQKYVEREKIE